MRFHTMYVLLAHLHCWFQFGILKIVSGFTFRVPPYKSGETAMMQGQNQIEGTAEPDYEPI
jgi:hypothetical protein